MDVSAPSSADGSKGAAAANTPAADRPTKRSRMYKTLTSSSKRPQVGASSSLSSPGKGGTSVRLVGSSSGSLTRSFSDQKAGNTRHRLPYAPWNQEHFLRRLSTFANVRNWSSKPEGIDDVAWAKRGWVCWDKDQVACTLCGKHMIVRLQDDDKSGERKLEENDESEWLDAETEKRLIERYRDLIVDGHDTDCLWRKGGCKGALNLLTC